MQSICNYLYFWSILKQLLTAVLYYHTQSCSCMTYVLVYLMTRHVMSKLFLCYIFPFSIKRKLKAELRVVKKKGAKATDHAYSTRVCARCNNTMGLIFNTPTQCPVCNHKVSKCYYLITKILAN